ncbi:MAG: hypothetical protein ACM3TR_16420 [Caulobacteraceae bacterium]
MDFLKKNKMLICISLVSLIILAAYVFTIYPTPQKSINDYLLYQFKNDLDTPKFYEFKKSLALMGITTISPELNKNMQLTSTLTLYVYSSKLELDKDNTSQYLVYFHFTEYWKDNSVKQGYTGLMQVLLEKTSPLHRNVNVIKISPVKPVDKNGGVSFILKAV